MKLSAIGGVVSVLGLLTACAQQEEPTIVRPEPVFDKYGGGGTCTDGYVYVPGANFEPPRCVPEDECTPVYDTAGNVIACPPPRTQRDPSSSDGTSDGGQTTGGGQTAAGGPNNP